MSTTTATMYAPPLGRMAARIQRLKRVAGSFATVLVLYCAYALIAVPLIEPNAEEIRKAESLAHPGVSPDDSVEVQRRQLMAWFKPGDWELTSPKMIETSQGILLIKDYQNLPDGKVEIRPCTMIFVPEGPPDTLAARQRKALVLRCPSGAVLEFDTPLDLKQAQIGRLVGGQLRGEVKITSDQKYPGPEDDLLILTHDVVLADETIRAAGEVRFEMGANRGHGRRLTMSLAPKGQADNSHGVRWLELAENIEFHLESNNADLFPGAGQDRGPKRSQPVDVRCAGPFRFDFVQQSATFDQRVNLLRANLAGPSDQMTCDRLTIFFESADGDHQGTMPKMTPARLEAWGNPLVIEAPSREMSARAQLLAYDLKTRGATLHDEHEVRLDQGRRELHAREVFFQPDASGKLGTFLATGRGWLRGALPDDETQVFQAQWSSRLHFRPHEGNHVLSIEGAAHVDVPDKGSLDGEEIHLWLFEAPPALAGAAGGIETGKVQLMPERMLAKGDVKIDAPQLVGAVGELQCWFDHQEPGPDLAPPIQPGVPGETVGPRLGPAMPQTIGNVVRPQPPLGSQVVELIPTPPPAAEHVAAPPGMGAPPGFAPPTPVAAAPPSRYQLTGGVVRARTIVRGSQTQLSELMIEQDVHVVQIEPVDPGRQPLEVTGQFVHVEQPRPEQARIKVMGQPARILANGMTISSDVIHFDQAAMSAHTDGAGTLTMPANRDLDGRMLSQSQMLEVTWQGQMQFDGQTARFDREVAARLGPQLAKTESLTATFTRPLTMGGRGGTPLEEKPEIEQVALRDGAYIEQRSFEGDKLVSFDRLYAADLVLQPGSGEMQASGPGRVVSVRLGSGANGLSGANPVAVPSNPRGEELTFLQVEFQRRLSGNRQSHALTFEHQVHALYGPVPNWDSVLDPNRPETWGENGIMLSSDRLVVVEMGGAPGSPRNYEMEATGNTVVEGNTFTARAGRLTYAQVKDLLVLEGTTNDARLFKQTRPGAQMSEFAARKIMYWPRTKEVRVDDARFLDLNNIPSSK